MAQISFMLCHPFVILSMSALIKVMEAEGLTAVTLKSLVLLYNIEMRPPRAMVIARKVRCWLWLIEIFSDAC